MRKTFTLAVIFGIATGLVGALILQLIGIELTPAITTAAVVGPVGAFVVSTFIKQGHPQEGK